MNEMNLKLFTYRFKLTSFITKCMFLLVMFLIVKCIYSWHSLPKNVRQFIEFNEGYTIPSPKMTQSELNELSVTVNKLNIEHKVFNEKQFGPVVRSTTTIVIQVHKDVERLQFLIASLSQVIHIETVVIVFSHSFYDKIINDYIAKITFCRYVQIFYPMSVQLHPNQFPGDDLDNCSKSGNGKCIKRNAQILEHKHHWWWQAHFVFDTLWWPAKYDGIVIFLEENHYVLPDLLHMLRHMQQAASIIPVKVLSFGCHAIIDEGYDKLIVLRWQPLYHIGLAFNKTVWREISAIPSHFCTYNDIRWSYSLYNLFKKLRDKKPNMMYTYAPRVLTISEGEVSGRSGFMTIQSLSKDFAFFPTHVKAVVTKDQDIPLYINSSSDENYQWDDARDHSMCLYALYKPKMMPF